MTLNIKFFILFIIARFLKSQCEVFSWGYFGLILRAITKSEGRNDH